MCVECYIGGNHDEELIDALQLNEIVFLLATALCVKEAVLYLTLGKL